MFLVFEALNDAHRINWWRKLKRLQEKAVLMLVLMQCFKQDMVHQQLVWNARLWFHMEQQKQVDNARRICRAVSVPVIVDSDTGYGNALECLEISKRVRICRSIAIFGFFLRIKDGQKDVDICKEKK